jgi:hypothetical protein
VQHDDALRALATFEKRSKQLSDEWSRLSEAKRVLGMESHDVDRLAGPIIELAGLKEIWTLLRGVLKGLADLKETNWQKVQVFQVGVRCVQACGVWRCSALLSRGAACVWFSPRGLLPVPPSQASVCCLAKPCDVDSGHVGRPSEGAAQLATGGFHLPGVHSRQRQAEGTQSQLALADGAEIGGPEGQALGSGAWVGWCIL